MSVRALVAGVVLVLSGCAANSGGQALWEEACAHALAAVEEPEPTAYDECVEGLRGYPRAVADDIARCTLKGPRGAEPEAAKRTFEACVRPETEDYLGKQEAANILLGELAAELGRRATSGPLPETLAVLKGAEVVGPWGHPVVYVRKDDDKFELAIVGPDGVSGTADDIRWEPAEFVYFQF